MAEATIAAGYPRGLLAFAASRGAHPTPMLAAAGLSEAELNHQDNRVPVARYVALIEAAQELTGDPAIALKYGQAVRMQDISIVGLICEACATTAEVGAALNRYAALVLDDDRAEPLALMRAAASPEGVWIEAPPSAFADNSLILEAEFARLTWNGRVMFATCEEFKSIRYPAVIHFTHSDPGYGEEYRRVFDAPVVFNSHWNAMLVDHAFVALKQPPVNRYVFGMLSERADALLKELQASTSTRGQVERRLAATLHNGGANMDTIADQMGMSRQTLYRNLRAEGATFEQVLDELRHKLALSFLADKQVSVNQTAYLVGFSEPAAFSRAFKRWTGQSPSAVRG